MRSHPVLGAVAILGLLIAFVVALLIGTAPDGQVATAVEWTIQILVLVGAAFLLAGRIRRRS